VWERMADAQPKNSKFAPRIEEERLYSSRRWDRTAIGFPQLVSFYYSDMKRAFFLTIVLLVFLLHQPVIAFRTSIRFPVVGNGPVALLVPMGGKSRLSMSSGGLAAKPPVVEAFGKGLSSDFKRKWPHFKSDFTQGFNIKSLASTFFLFFACLAPAIAFGGLLGTATGGMMGTMETVGATAIGGIIYALMSGQPLTIIGTTGPLLAFLKVLFDACAAKNLPFLPIYAWVGLWSSLFLYLSAFFSTSNVVEYFSRFTDDIFSSLISVIFIVEATKDLLGNFKNPLIPGVQATVSLIVAFLTFATAKILSQLRKTTLLNRTVRDKVSDFAPTLGVLSGCAFANYAIQRYGLSLSMLKVPLVLGTTSGRPWLIDIFAVDVKTRLLCIFPAFMATILLFMDQNITVRLMMAKEHKLKKGSGLHLDMLAVAIVTTITSLTGMPWMVAATVRSLAHMRSLKLYKTESDGEPVGVQEQRVTGLLIHSLIGCSVLYWRNYLRQLPNAVLTGLFMYLGVSSINTTDLWSRFMLFFTDKRDVPKTEKWSSLPLPRIKMFTAIQLALLGGMFWLKGTSLGVFFPVLIGFLPPVRIALEKFKVFSTAEVDLMDGEIAE